jgi:uncharacterized protein
MRWDIPMKERALDPGALDVMALCNAGAALQGRLPLAGMQRLADSLCAASDGSAPWQVRGSLAPVQGSEAEVWLELQADAEVPLQCQRCLQPMVEQLQVRRRFRFVRNEEQAARLDEESEDDVLVLPQRLDLHALLEDELILALPLVPRHGSCPQPLAQPADPLDVEATAPNPFASLAGLRGRLPGGA